MSGPLDNRFSTTNNGAITFTGNTIGLSKKNNSQDAGTAHSIGAMITTNNALNVPTYPTDPEAGTTLDYTLNGSFAYLNLPEGSTVLYADLIWAGSYRTENENLSAFINNSVTLTTPAASNPIKADNSYEIFSGNSVYYYLRVADVTTYIQALSMGLNKITCSGIVATTDPSENVSNAGGWTLCVVYQNPSMPSRNMTIYTGNNNTFVGAGSDASATASGFETPATGAVKGRIAITAIEGDAVLLGDKAAITDIAGTHHFLYGPRNLVDNFFSSQICDDNGNVDVLGSFGNKNQNPNGTNIVAGRQGWDITNVDANPAPNVNLNNSQTSTVVDLTSDGDRYWVTGIGIQIDVNSPNLIAIKAVDKPTVVIDEKIKYTITIENKGTATASSVVVTDNVPNGAVYVDGSLTVSVPSTSVPSPPGSFPPTIVLTNPLPPNGKVTITFEVVATTIPNSRVYQNSATIDYTYPIPGNPTNPGQAITNIVSTSIMAPLPPIVENYYVETCKNTPTEGVVTAVDVDMHYPLNFSIDENPTNGFAAIDPISGKWHYTPKVGFSGIDSFKVKVQDSEFADAYSIITIKVLDKFCCEINCKNCCS